MRAIDADALIKDRIENGVNWYLGESEGFRQLIERQPTITERTAEFRNVHLSYDGDDDDTWECSECKQAWIIEGNPKEHRYNYCPNCGAKFQEADHANAD